MISKVLEKMGETVQARGMIYTAVSETVLFYGRKSWVVTGAMLNILEGFHHRAAIEFAGMTGKCVADEMWEYNLVMAAL